MQRNLIIVATVIVLVGVGAYFYFSTDTAGVAVAPEGSASLPIAEGVKPTTGTNDTGTTATTNQVSAPQVISARLVKISAGPVVPGMVVVNKKATASSSAEVSVNYIERRSGNIYSYLASAKTNTRTSNKTVPGIQSAMWFPNASSTIVRYLSGADF